jgi:hypothetical protein
MCMIGRTFWGHFTIKPFGFIVIFVGCPRRLPPGRTLAAGGRGRGTGGRGIVARWVNLAGKRACRGALGHATGRHLWGRRMMPRCGMPTRGALDGPEGDEQIPGAKTPGGILTGWRVSREHGGRPTPREASAPRVEQRLLVAGRAAAHMDIGAAREAPPPGNDAAAGRPVDGLPTAVTVGGARMITPPCQNTLSQNSPGRCSGGSGVPPGPFV